MYDTSTQIILTILKQIKLVKRFDNFTANRRKMGKLKFVSVNCMNENWYLSFTQTKIQILIFIFLIQRYKYKDRNLFLSL